MKTAILFHGSSGTPNSFWLPGIKRFLEWEGYSVWAPQLPNPEAPDLKVQLPFVLNGGVFSKDTIVIGHSSGCPLILSVLERIDVRIRKAILVAGFARSLKKHSEPSIRKLEDAAEPILQQEYDWERIRAHVADIVFINSDNDPWGCDDKEGLYLFQNLGGTLIIRHGEGHMGSDLFKQPYKEFPLLEALIRL